MARFPTTRFSLVTNAADGSPEAIAELMSSYRGPLVSHLCRKWGMPLEEAEDTVQEFITERILQPPAAGSTGTHESTGNLNPASSITRRDTLLSKVDSSRGHFRSYLLRCLNNFVISRQRLRRTRISTGHDCLEIGTQASPTESTVLAFEAEWALELVIHALRRFQGMCHEGDDARWALFVHQVLEPLVGGRRSKPLASLYGELGFPTVKAAENAATSGRRTLRTLLRACVRERIVQRLLVTQRKVVSARWADSPQLPSAERIERLVDDELLDALDILNRWRSSTVDLSLPATSSFPAGGLLAGTISEALQRTLAGFGAESLVICDGQDPRVECLHDILETPFRTARISNTTEGQRVFTESTLRELLQSARPDPQSLQEARNFALLVSRRSEKPGRDAARVVCFAIIAKGLCVFGDADLSATDPRSRETVPESEIRKTLTGAEIRGDRPAIRDDLRRPFAWCLRRSWLPDWLYALFREALFVAIPAAELGVKSRPLPRQP